MKGNMPILLVEDDRFDVAIVERAFREIKVENRLDVVSDGEQALAFLKDAGNERPQLILLDLNMPRMNGFEFLEITKQDDRLRRIPVVVLTSSDEERDILKCYELGVCGYMLKPVDYIQFVEVIKTIDRYWTVSEIPPG